LLALLLALFYGVGFDFSCRWQLIEAFLEVADNPEDFVEWLRFVRAAMIL